jgi:hypothetical protein
MMVPLGDTWDRDSEAAVCRIAETLFAREASQINHRVKALCMSCHVDDGREVARSSKIANAGPTAPIKR